jgi:hypothetical protein
MLPDISKGKGISGTVRYVFGQAEAVATIGNRDRKAGLHGSAGRASASSKIAKTPSWRGA